MRCTCERPGEWHRHSGREQWREYRGATLVVCGPNPIVMSGPSPKWEYYVQSDSATREWHGVEASAADAKAKAIAVADMLSKHERQLLELVGNSLVAT